MIYVNSIEELKKVALSLVPSIKYRNSYIVFLEKETNFSYKPGIRWSELWASDRDDSRDFEIFNPKNSSSPGYVEMHRDFLMIIGISHSEKGLRVIVSGNFDID